MIYDYYFVRMPLTVANPQASLAKAVAERAPRAREAGGEIVGLFSPALGYSIREAAILLRWRDQPADVLADMPLIASRTVDRLSATVRPAAEDQLRTGGIYVHRWFTVEAARADEFVDLSGRFWQGGFEASAQTQVFGLFKAARTEADGPNARLLLMTWYASHTDWDISRQQSPEAASILRHRSALTLDTRGVSTRVTPLA